MFFKLLNIFADDGRMLLSLHWAKASSEQVKVVSTLKP